MDRVLIVDDDAQLLTILKEAFKEYKNKFEVVTAQDGLAAIIALRKQRISLLVTDIRMPIVNGLVLLAYMTKNYPKIPCIVMTGYGTPFLRKRLQQETACYMEKPFKVTELAQAIMSVLGQREVLGGTLKGISLAGFVQLIETEYVTCLCEITTPGGEKGYLAFDQGVLHDAFSGRLRGENAALRLLEMDDVTIRFRKPPKKKIAKRIQVPLAVLLTKAAGRGDEVELPGGKGHVSLAEGNRRPRLETDEGDQTEKSLKKAKETAEAIERHLSASSRGTSKETQNE